MVSSRLNGSCRTNTSSAIRMEFSTMSRLIVSLIILLNVTGKVDAYNVVRVCQNKHCCRRANNGDVLQTMHNLIDTSGEEVVVEASGCLSECDKGPNVELTVDGKTTLLHGIVDAQTCAFQLGESALQIPKILMAASKVMEQSQQFSENGQFEEAIRFLTSVIDKLEASPAVSPATAANAHAHALRAQAFLELAIQNQEESDPVAASISDAKRVVQDFSGVATSKSLAMAYRTWTDAELFLAEQEQLKVQETERPKDFSKVVAVLKEWYQAQPMYRTKLQGEIQGLLLNA